MIFSAVFLISAVLFALEVLQMRVLSFISWHHMTYMVLAVALMGYAAAGTVLAVKKGLKNYEKSIHIFSVLFTVSIPLAVALSSRISLDPTMPNKIFMITFLFCDYILLFLPHFFGGLILLSVFQNRCRNVNISYFFSVIGSVAGCFMAFPLMESAGMEAALLILTLLAAVSSVLIALASKRGRFVRGFSVLLVVLTVVLLPFRKDIFVFRSAPSKFLNIVGGKSEMTKWDRAGRVDISKDKGPVLLNDWADFQKGIIANDGDAGSFIYDFSDNRQQVAVSLYSTGYFGLQNPDVFIAGLSTTDISAALFWQAKSVTAVEVNKSVIDLNLRKYSTFKDNILRDGKVSILHGEVREFLENSDKKYDLIQLSGTDTVVALMNGAYIMNESYLYTEEAFRTYFNRLSDNGTLSFIRWLLWPPRETLRVAVTASSVLKDMGIEHPENNIVIIGANNLAGIVIKKRPFTWSELNEISEIIAATKELRIIYAPGFSAGPRYYDPVVKGVNFSADQAIDFINSGFNLFFESVRNGTEKEFIENYPYNIAPVSDDKPFFFNYLKFGGEILPEEVKVISGDNSPFAVTVLLLTFLQLLFLSLSLLVTPLFFMSKDEKKFSPLLQIPAFAAIGFGFMFVEMTLIQKFTLLFGDPATSAATAIGLLLVFSALGSLFSKKILILSGEKLFFSGTAIIVPLMILGYAAVMPHFMAFCAGSGFAMKLLLTALFTAPLGFTMGTVFPVSLLLAGEKKPFFIPLAFSAEGAASVLATVVSVIIAMAYGFKFVFVLAAFCYFFAAAAMLYFEKKRV